MIIREFHNGKLVEEREEPDEIAPLDPQSQILALLAAKQVITVKEAADLSGRTEKELSAEVMAWAAARK